MRVVAVSKLKCTHTYLNFRRSSSLSCAGSTRYVTKRLTDSLVDKLQTEMKWQKGGRLGE